MNSIANKCRYINEGNVHIVLEISDTNQVLRLIKGNVKEIPLDVVKSSVDFVNLVITPLIYYEYKNEVQILEIAEDEIQRLCKTIFAVRPEKRRFKSVFCKYAVMAPNLTKLSIRCKRNYCIEIKPKEGFVSSDFSQYSKCYYCLKQFFKLQQKEIETVSKYCPVDFFSGEKHRMTLALMNLINNPQNNLKLFINSKLVFNEESSAKEMEDIIQNINVFETLSQFLDFVIKTLLNINRGVTQSRDTNVKLEDLDRKRCVEGTGLDEKSLLYKLLKLQKLSEINVDNTNTSYQELEYLPQIFDKLHKEKLDLSKDRDRESFLSTLDHTQLSLISAVAKDCSLMISFSTDYCEGSQTIQIGDHKIPYSVAITDLEPKSAKTLDKRKTMQKKLIEIYERHIMQSAEFECKIQPHKETRAKQLEAWQHLIAEYLKTNKQSTIDIRESQNSPLFNNSTINRKLSQESILIVLEDMARSGKAAPVDKSKNIWEIYWHSLDEWGSMIYNWATNNGLTNSVCTLFELREGDNTIDEEFHGLDMNVLVKALKSLEAKGKCELMEFDDNQGVKFF